MGIPLVPFPGVSSSAGVDGAQKFHGMLSGAAVNIIRKENHILSFNSHMFSYVTWTWFWFVSPRWLPGPSEMCWYSGKFANLGSDPPAAQVKLRKGWGISTWLTLMDRYRGEIWEPIPLLPISPVLPPVVQSSVFTFFSTTRHPRRVSPGNCQFPDSYGHSLSAPGGLSIALRHLLCHYHLGVLHCTGPSQICYLMWY